ncbi:hypothetical protein WME91_04515 [Sorangium sp. So ce269]
MARGAAAHADVLFAPSAVARFKNAAFDFIIEDESSRPRRKPKRDDSNTAAPVPTRSKPPTRPLKWP